MSEPKPCPFHNSLTCACVDDTNMSVKEWNTRPIEDALNARIAELEAIADKLGNALKATYNKLPPHWRGADWCPYDYQALMVELNRLFGSEK